MNIDKYRVFLMIGEHMHLSEIAKRLSVSQPTISFHMKSLEESMGVKLFQGNRKNVILTETGINLCPYIQEIVRMEDVLQKRADAYKNYAYGEIKIGTTLSPGVSILPDALKRFSEEYHNIHIEVENRTAHEIIQNTMQKKYHIGLVATDSDIPKELVTETLGWEKLVFVFHADFASDFHEKADLQILSQFPFIHHGIGSSTRKVVDGFLEKNQIIVQSFVTIDSASMIKALVLQKQGISILPYSLVKQELCMGILKTIDFNIDLPQKEIKLIYPSNWYVPPHVVKFMERLKDRV